MIEAGSRQYVVIQQEHTRKENHMMGTEPMNIGRTSEKPVLCL